MATVSNWIDHLNKPAEEVGGSVYPGAGSSEFITSSFVNCCVDRMDCNYKQI